MLESLNSAMTEPTRMSPLLSGDLTLDLSSPVIMGVVNVTPDSFSDGGRYLDHAAAVTQAETLRDAGASIIDIGGESTRPGAQPVSVQQELDRVLPVLEAVRDSTDAWISVDTSTPEVMAAAAKAGANMLNDVRALTRPGALAMAASLRLPVCLMHMQGQPAHMQKNPDYDDVVNQVLSYLNERTMAAEEAGIARQQLVLDPGFGFGKTLDHNLALLRALPALAELGYPLLVGMSRKTMIGDITGQPVTQRLAGSLAAAVMAAQLGAHIIRVHDVAETRDALAVWRAVERN